MKKLLRIMLLIPLCGLLVFLGAGLMLAFYYSGNFPVNTWINGVYCTGKSIEEVNAELAAQTQLPELIIKEPDGTEWKLSLEQAGGSADYRTALKAYLHQNATYRWMKNLKEPVDATLKEQQYAWNHDKLSEMFEQLGFVEKARKDSAAGVRVQLTEDGYTLYDGNSSRLDCDKALSYIEGCLAAGQSTVALAEGGCYRTLEDTPQDKKERRLWKELEELFACDITYDMGAEQIPLTPQILSRFVKIEDDSVLLLEDGIREWVEELAKDYDTEGTTRDFAATRGELVQVSYVTYGTVLDTETEISWLTQNFWEERGQHTEPTLHVPAYLKEGYARGLDDIGDTYIEIDMTEQHLYYYADGELALDTDIVTGNLARKMGTPEGINFVYNKQKNRVLRGPGYASPVKFWMPVKGGIGIHDASWRSEFGGEIYKKSGSHGCINVATEDMTTLYDLVEIGTPVVMFY